MKLKHVVWVLLLMSPPALLAGQSEAAYTGRQLAINDYHIRDIVVIDVNDDNALDLFTTNCSFIQNLRLGDGQGGFGEDALSAWGLDHRPEFPGFANKGAVPELKSPGLYIYLDGRHLLLRSFNLESLGVAVHGSMVTMSRVLVKNKEGFSVTTSSEPVEGGNQTTADFGTGQSGLLELAWLSTVKAQFKIDPSLPLENIFIGPQGANPTSRDFQLYVHDRHGSAWADFNRDGKLDVFIDHGGLNGGASATPDLYNDELLCGDGAHFTDCTEGSGIYKNAAHGRSAAWIDYNGDGRLDLLVGNEETRLKLFRQNADGSFLNVATRLGLNLNNGGPCKWLDVDGDGDSDFLVSADPDILLFRNDSGSFTRISLGKNPTGVHGASYGKISVADYDTDGDPDVFISSVKGNVVLVNQNGSFIQVDPVTLGLPQTCLYANFVDYDNDGRPDLYCPPYGLYRQGAGHKFVRKSMLRSAIPATVPSARSLWFDANNDGAMDLLVSYAKKIDPDWGQWQTFLYLSDAPAKHWLQVKLVGMEGNREAIGARVKVSSGKLVQTQEIGFAEDSRYSQGHYRLYFGLNLNTQVDSVEVFWPDGTITTLKKIAADQLLKVAHP